MFIKIVYIFSFNLFLIAYIFIKILGVLNGYNFSLGNHRNLIFQMTTLRIVNLTEFLVLDHRLENKELLFKKKYFRF